MIYINSGTKIHLQTTLKIPLLFGLIWTSKMTRSCVPGAQIPRFSDLDLKNPKSQVPKNPKTSSHQLNTIITLISSIKPQMAQTAKSTELHYTNKENPKYDDFRTCVDLH